MDEPGRHSTRPVERNTSGEKFGRNQIVLIYGQWAKNCWFLGETILSELSTPHSICSAENFFGQNGFFSLKINKFDIFFWFWMTKFQICGTSFRQECQKQCPRDQRTSLVKRSLGEDTTLYLLMVFPRKFWFARKLQFRQWNILRVQWNTLSDKILEETNFSNFWVLSKNVLDFWQNKFGRVAKTPIHVTRATFGVNWTFFRKKMQF